MSMLPRTSVGRPECFERAVKQVFSERYAADCRTSNNYGLPRLSRQYTMIHSQAVYNGFA